MIGFNFETGVLLSIIITFISILIKSNFTVEEGFIAVLTRFGEVVENEDKVNVYHSGIHFKMPWDKVHFISLMEHLVDLTHLDEEKELLKDGTLISAEAKFRYSIDPKNLYGYFFKLKNSEEHIKTYFLALLKQELANFPEGKNGELGSFARLRSGRSRFSELMKEKSKMISEVGIKFHQIDINEIVPPKELDDALNAVIKAKVESETMYSHAEAECSQRVISSEVNVGIAKDNAESSEKEIIILCDYLKELKQSNVLDEYVGRRKLEVLHDSKNIFKNL